MSGNRQNSIVHVLPSLTDVAFLLPLIFMFARFSGARTLLGDADTGWHIKTGEWILAHHQVPHTDLFSFTKPGAQWFAWEWLCDVLFGWLNQHWGLAGVVALSMLLLCTTSALLFRLIRRRCPNPLIAIAFTFVAMSASTIHWHARPHLFTFFFTVVFLHILDRVRDGGAGKSRLLWILPLLTAVWVNIHGGFMVGVILLTLHTVGELVAWALDEDRVAAGEHLRAGRMYGLTLLGCGVASLANPYTYRLHLFIYEFLGQPFLNGIAEWRSPNFHSPYLRFFEALLILALAGAVWNLLQRRYLDVLVVVAFAHLSLIAVRNVPVFVFVATPIAARAIWEMMESLENGAPLRSWFRGLLNQIQELGAEMAQTDRAWRMHVLSVAAFVVVAYAMTSGRLGASYTASFDPKSFPVNAAETLATRPDNIRVFTIDQWADFLIYRYSPLRRVYYDGRTDMYGSTFFEEYGKVVNAGWDWQKILDKYQVQTILVPVNTPLTSALKESKLWRPVYDDRYAIIFDRMNGKVVKEGQPLSIAADQTGRATKAVLSE